MKKNIIILLILSMLAVYIPSMAASAAESDAREILDMSMVSTSQSINGLVDDNTRLTASQAHGRGSVNRKITAWTNINYTSVADGADWVGFGMELKNGASRDYSAIAENAKITYTVKFEAAVDANNLYFTVRSANGAVAGVAADPYINSDEDNNGVADVYEKLITVNIPLSSFTSASAKNFIDGAAFNAAEFSGMGIARCADPSNPESTGKIHFTKMSVINIPQITDLEASTSSSITLSFTKPEITTIDKYEIVKYDGIKTQTIICTDDDLTVVNGKYTYTDRAVETETDYSYKIRMHESEYDIYSSFSNTVNALISEDDGGEIIPSDNADTKVWDVVSRDFEWITDRVNISAQVWYGVSANVLLDYNVTASGKLEGLSTGTAPIPGMGRPTGKNKINKWDFNPSKFIEAEDYNPDDGHPYNPYRGYMVSGMATNRDKGGSDGTVEKCVNLSAYKDTGYAVFWVYLDENLPLENLYFALGSGYADGRNGGSNNYVCVPVSDYVKEEDKGKAIYVSIPLADFRLSNPNAFQNVWNTTWAGVDTPDMVKEIDWERIQTIGFARRIYDGNNGSSDTKLVTPSYSDAYIYEGGMFVTNVNPVTDFTVYDVKEDKVILKWTHTDSAAVKYNIYRTDGDGERKLIGTTEKNQYSDYYADGNFPTGVTFTYDIEAVDKYGAKSQSKSASTLIRSIDRPRKFRAVSQESATAELAVDLSWEAPLFVPPLGGLEKYVLYRNGAEYMTFTPGETSYRDTSLTEHETYTYTMKAVATDGSESILTVPITVTATALYQPTGLSYQVKNSNSVELIYSAPDYAEKFYIYLNGEKIDETTENTFTADNVPYDTALVFGVRAVNAAGATSNETQTQQFIIKNPKMSPAMTIFDEAINSNLSKEPSTGVSMTETNAKSIIGNKSMALNFTTRKSARTYAAFGGKIDIREYRENGGRFGFWLYADDKTDYTNLQVGVSTTASVGTGSAQAYALVPVSDYVTEKNKWTYVEIPLTDIPEYATGTYNTVTKRIALDFGALKQIVFSYDNSKQTEGPIVYIDQFAIDTGNAWSVTSTADDRGNPGMAMSANTKTFKVSFSDEMDPESFTTEGTYVAYDDNGTERYVNYYGTYSGNTYTMNFLESLKPNTDYTLEIKGAKTTEGKSGSYSGTMHTNSDAITPISYTVPDIAVSFSTKSEGASTVVTVSMPEGANDLIGNYTVRLAYNKNVIKPNKNSVTNLPEGASATDTGSAVVVAGTKGNSKLTGNLMQIKFATVTPGNTEITVTGTADVYNSKADVSNTASFTGSTSFFANASSSTGPSSPGGSSGGTKADRPDRSDIQPTPAPDDKPSGNVSFTDLDSVPWAEEAIGYLAKEGYIDGYDDGTFKPNKTITREEFAKMIVNVLGFQDFNFEMTDMSDVDKDAWYANYVTIAVASKLINGIGDNKFGTGVTISRQDMCTIIYRAIKSESIKASYIYDEIQFKDEASDYAQEAIREMFRYGLVSGVGDNMFDPYGDVTRAMAAKVLYGLAKLL